MSRIHLCLKQVLFNSFILVYIFFLAKVLLFKYVSPFELVSAERMVTRTFNLFPLKTVFQYLGTNFNIWIAMMNVIGNIIIFVPLGMYLQVFKKNKKILICVAIICVISLCVEAIQYIFGIGAADVDDIILNTIGGLQGVLSYKILYAVLKDKNKIKTAIIIMWCILGVCFLIFMSYITFFTGYKIRVL